MIIFHFIVENGGMMELCGILVGHMYFFLMFKYPQDFGGPSLLSTPDFLYRIFPNRRGGVSGYGQAPASAQQGDQGVREEVEVVVVAGNIFVLFDQQEKMTYLAEN